MATPQSTVKKWEDSYRVIIGIVMRQSLWKYFMKSQTEHLCGGNDIWYILQFVWIKSLQTSRHNSIVIVTGGKDITWGIVKTTFHQVGVGRSTRELRPDTNNAVFDSRVLSKHQVGPYVDFVCLGTFVSSSNNGYWKLEIQTKNYLQ